MPSPRLMANLVLRFTGPRRARFQLSAADMVRRSLSSSSRSIFSQSNGAGNTSNPHNPSPIRCGYYCQQAIRCNSGKSGPPELRQWGFEDINSRLPVEPATSAPSPSHKPEGGLILIDVREPAELTATGMIPTAVSIPLQSQPDALFLSPDEFETRFGFPKPGIELEEHGSQKAAQGPIVFYCRSGVRARAAAQLAAQAGYDPEKIGVYTGSWLDWADKKGRVEKWKGSE